jgi:hypothetical protein
MPLSRRSPVSSLVVLAVLVAAAIPRSATAEPTKCTAAIVKASAAFVQARAKTIAKCELAVVKGILPHDTECRAEAKGAAKLVKIAHALRAAIAKSCGGKDKTCGTADDDPLAAIGFAGGACPDFEHVGCTNAIADCDGIATCLACIDAAAVDQATGLTYDAFTPTDRKLEKALSGCQAGIGNAASAFLAAKSRALAACWRSAAKGGGGPCPDGKAAAAIAGARS